jgi:ribosomal protein S27AE
MEDETRQMEDAREKNDIAEVRWAPRVNPNKIRRLYETDARGIVDDELIEEVGFAFYSRCRSILTATEAHAGRVECPRCGSIVLHHGDRNALIRCDQCSWQVRWGDYFKTYQDKHLHGGGAVWAFRSYIEEFTKARSSRERMLAIDRLIHVFHCELVQDPVRSVGVNLIYGKNTREVTEFLDRLTYGEATSPELKETKVAWDRKLELSQRYHPIDRHENKT